MSTTRNVNISHAERVARIGIGIAGILAAAVLLTSASSAAVVALEFLLGLAGLDLVVTGATGHCPLYEKLGHVPRSFRGRAAS
jgi:hypothetical protein